MKAKKLDLTIDFHAHVLPGCDHGSKNMKTSEKQLQLAKEAGVTRICATSHFYPHKESVSSFLKRREECFAALNPKGIPEVIPGAEVLICPGMEELPQLPELCLQGTNYLLLEMPFYKWPEQIVETALAIHERDDIYVILAHVDRYPKEDIDMLFAEGLHGQLNADSVATKRLHRKTYLNWIQNGQVLFLGSDIHGTDIGYQYWEKCKKILK
jgi:protein-tyrosine phosphatase